MVERIKEFFKMKKVKPDFHFYLHEGHRLYDPFTKYYNIICKHLERRDEVESYDDKLYERREFQGTEITYYELEMMLDLYKASDYLIPLYRIQNLDGYCAGSVDYVKKYALRLAEEEEISIKGWGKKHA